MADIFLSYARRDRLSVEPIARQLIYDGWTLWWDPEITGGGQWHQLIATELASARVVLVAWSSTSLASDWVRDEAGEGKRRDGLVSISIDGSEPPLGFRQLQCLPMAGWRFERESESYQQLYNALRRKIGDPRGTVTESLETVQQRFSGLAAQLVEANKRMLAIREKNVRLHAGEPQLRDDLLAEIDGLRKELGANSEAFHHVNDAARALGEFMTQRLVATGTSVLSGYLATLRALDDLLREIEKR